MATDGLIEGIEIEKAKMAIAVQWHPEFLYKMMNHHKNYLIY